MTARSARRGVLVIAPRRVTPRCRRRSAATELAAGLGVGGGGGRLRGVRAGGGDPAAFRPLRPERRGRLAVLSVHAGVLQAGRHRAGQPAPDVQARADGAGGGRTGRRRRLGGRDPPGGARGPRTASRCTSRRMRRRRRRRCRRRSGPKDEAAGRTERPRTSRPARRSATRCSPRTPRRRAARRALDLESEEGITEMGVALAVADAVPRSMGLFLGTPCPSATSTRWPGSRRRATK